MTTPPTSQQLTPAEIRLAQYGERTSTWSTATYDTGTEKALHEIALGLKAELDRVREQRKYLIAQLAKKDAASGEGDRALRKFLAADDDSSGPEHVDDCPGFEGNPVAPDLCAGCGESRRWHTAAPAAG